MNYIVSAYLTSGIDLQRNTVAASDSEQYIDNWYNSIISLGLNGVVIQDSLSDNFMSKYPEITFYKVDTLSDNASVYDYRWLCFYNWFKEVCPEKVFFTDLHDVKVIRNPFPEMEEGKLYCGDEEIAMVHSSWIQGATNCEILSGLDGFLEIIRSDRKLLNCGLFGGDNEKVNEFLLKLTYLINSLSDRKPSETVDMPLFIYTAYKNFSDSIIHGFPVNSVFGANEIRDDVWFIHK